MKILVIVTMCMLPMLAAAQIEATTREGKTVLLFENGTWEYAPENKVQHAQVDNMKIEKGLTAESPLEELFYAESKRLVKYFGSIKGKIKGQAKCMITEGQPKVFFQWEVRLLDSYRYFGQMKAGKKVTLKTKNNTPIELVLTKDIDLEFVEKYNFSIFKGTCNLSEEEFKMLMNSPISAIEVEWKKESETYPMNDAYYFAKTFGKLLK